MDKQELALSAIGVIGFLLILTLPPHIAIVSIIVSTIAVAIAAISVYLDEKLNENEDE